MIEFYTSPTPNGHKISCALEHMKIPYKTITINLREHEQFSKEFTKLNPNHKIPAILDTSNNLKLAESGAILIYLAEKSGLLYPEKNKYEILQWLMFQMAHIGPMMGQANVFYRYLDEKLDTAISRYHKECRRLFEVMDNHLSENEFLTEEFSIADIANWCWIRTYKWSGIDFTGLDHLSRWMKQIYSIEGMKEGLDVPISQEDLKKYYESKIGRGGNNIVIK
tara:strand:- start:1022 stop:1690 length:669 start_codon:yes stop_codon:yes gene_type:complete